MALTVDFTVKRSELSVPLGTPQTRGMVLGNAQTEMQVVTKLTGDTAHSNLDLAAIQRPVRVFSMALKDSGGADVVASTLATVGFTHNNPKQINLSGLGNWTRAVLFISGRSVD